LEATIRLCLSNPQGAEEAAAAGTSSFGMSGVNTHLLLRQQHAEQHAPPPAATKARLAATNLWRCSSELSDLI